jgi:hypothetical protein
VGGRPSGNSSSRQRGNWRDNFQGSFAYSSTSLLLTLIGITFTCSISQLSISDSWISVNGVPRKKLPYDGSFRIALSKLQEQYEQGPSRNSRMTIHFSPYCSIKRSCRNGNTVHISRSKVLELILLYLSIHVILNLFCMITLYRFPAEEVQRYLSLLFALVINLSDPYWSTHHKNS